MSTVPVDRRTLHLALRQMNHATVCRYDSDGGCSCIVAEIGRLIGLTAPSTLLETGANLPVGLELDGNGIPIVAPRLRVRP